jgi:Cu/Ag efflux pump CusA
MLAAIVRQSVRRPGVALALALLLLLYGSFRLGTASLDIFPEFAAKRVVVQTEAPGLSPEAVKVFPCSSPAPKTKPAGQAKAPVGMACPVGTA